jgi:hypothetical protein
MGTVKQRSRLFEGQPDCVRRSCQRRTGDACQLHRLHLAQPSWPPANCPFHRRLPTSRSSPNSLLVRQVFTAFVPPALGKPIWRSSIRHMPGRYRSGIDQRPRCRPAAHTRSIVRALSSAWSPDDPLGQADCPQRPPTGRQWELAHSTRHRSHSLKQARGTHCGSAGLSARRVPNGSLATSVSCRVDGAAALSARRA